MCSTNVMKTNAYNKEEHIEGYVGSDKKPTEKSDVQKEYEKGNDGNEVTSFGKETIAAVNSEKLTQGNNINARDGFDNTGTQGKDSLSDDTYNSKDKNPTIESAESHTGSSSKDFESNPKKEIIQRNEDDALNSGI